MSSGRFLRILENFRIKVWGILEFSKTAPRLRDDFCEFWRRASRGAVSAVAASEIFGWNFKDKVRRPNGLRSKNRPKSFARTSWAAQAKIRKKRPQAEPLKDKIAKF